MKRCVAASLAWLIGATMVGEAAATPPASPPDPRSESPQDGPAAGADTSRPAGRRPGLQDIVVTANRRPETVQRSSLSIESFDGETLAETGVTRVADLQNLVPSLTSASSGQNISTYVRGVGSLATDANADSSIAYNINGVFISRPNGVGPIFFDLERVEVLKGPQGTLYGRNASGGAINLITRRPDGHLSADLSVDIGNYDLVRISGAVSAPLGDTLSVRAAGQFTRHDGYLTDGYNDQRDLAARLTALWAPTDYLSLLLIGEFVDAGGQGSAAAFRSGRQAEPTDRWTGPSQAPPPQAALLGPDDILTNGFVDTRIYALSAELNWDLGGAILTILPAYRNTRPATLTYQPGFYFLPIETAEQQSYEVRLGHEGPQATWVVGAYYFGEDQTQDYTALARPIQQSHVVTRLGTDSYALFGELRFALAAPWRVIAGLRYSHDRKTQDGVTIATLPVPITIDNFGRRTDDNFSFRLGTEYDISDRQMVFATLATGYKAGGFFPSVPFPANTFEPETITAFTLGARNRLLGNRLQVNLEAFYWRYHDKQERFLGTLASGGVNLLTTNAGNATLYGFNLDVVGRFGAGTLRANVEYLHTRYDSFSYIVANAGPFARFGYSPIATSCALGPLTTLGPTVTTQPVDCAGKPLPHAPRWSGSVSYRHEFLLANGDRIVPSAVMRFASAMFLSPDFIPTARDDGYAALDASVTFAHGRFEISAWVRNLTNAVIYTGGFRYPFSFREPTGDPTTFYADIRPPRTFGLTLRTRL
jgi:iron complex outermembrane receptor protein